MHQPMFEFIGPFHPVFNQVYVQTLLPKPLYGTPMSEPNGLPDTARWNEPGTVPMPNSYRVMMRMFERIRETRLFENMPTIDLYGVGNAGNVCLWDSCTQFDQKPPVVMDYNGMPDVYSKGL